MQKYPQDIQLKVWNKFRVSFCYYHRNISQVFTCIFSVIMDSHSEKPDVLMRLSDVMVWLGSLLSVKTISWLFASYVLNYLKKINYLSFIVSVIFVVLTNILYYVLMYLDGALCNIAICAYHVNFQGSRLATSPNILFSIFETTTSYTPDLYKMFDSSYEMSHSKQYLFGAYDDNFIMSHGKILCLTSNTLILAVFKQI